MVLARFHWLRGFSMMKWSPWSGPAASVAISARPVFVTAVSTSSGNFSISTFSMVVARRVASESDTLGSLKAEKAIAPSSSFGTNSEPRNGKSKTPARKSAVAPSTVGRRCDTAQRSAGT